MSAPDIRELVEAGRRANIEARRQSAAPADPRPEANPVALPCSLVIPWSLLISDNERHTAGMRNGKPFVLTKSVYSQAKTKIAEIAVRATKAGIPVAEPLEFVGRVFPPRATRVDPTNFAKLVQDALSHVVYDDDRWLHRVVWERAETDVDAPRAEITIRPLESR